MSNNQASSSMMEEEEQGTVREQRRHDRNCPFANYMVDRGVQVDEAENHLESPESPVSNIHERDSPESPVSNIHERDSPESPVPNIHERDSPESPDQSIRRGFRVERPSLRQNERDSPESPDQSIHEEDEEEEEMEMGAAGGKVDAATQYEEQPDEDDAQMSDSSDSSVWEDIPEEIDAEIRQRMAQSPRFRNLLQDEVVLEALAKRTPFDRTLFEYQIILLHYAIMNGYMIERPRWPRRKNIPRTATSEDTPESGPEH